MIKEYYLLTFNQYNYVCMIVLKSKFMSIILFVIAQIFKRGIEIQSENEFAV
jgi:hypothetical protein